VPQAPLGVHRSVDRIDDDTRLGLAECPHPQLLRDEQEVVSLGVELLQQRDDRALGGIVDRGRLISADAGGQHRLALLPRRQVLQHPADVPRRRAADLEPGRHSEWKSKPERSLG